MKSFLINLVNILFKNIMPQYNQLIFVLFDLYVIFACSVSSISYYISLKHASKVDFQYKLLATNHGFAGNPPLLKFSPLLNSLQF